MTKRVWWSPIHLLVIVAAFLFMTANTAFGAYYLNRIYPGVSIAGVNVGGLTRQQAKTRLAEKLNGYAIDIQLDNEHYPLQPEKLGVEYDLETTLDMAWPIGRAAYPPLLGLEQSRKPAGLRFAYSVDQTKLTDFVETLAASKSQAPVDAAIVVTGGEPKVQPDKAGAGIDKVNLTRLLAEGFETQTTKVTLERQVLPAEVKAADLEPTLEASRKLLAAQIEIDYADKVFVPNANTMGSWLTYSKESGQPKTVVDRSKMEPYLKTVQSAIYIAPKDHLINTQNGVTTGEEAGVPGLDIDKEPLANSIIAAMNGGGSSKIAVTTHPIDFKTVYNRTISLDFGRYIEINLSTQHMWAYQDHKSIFESPITSGATGAGFATVTGLFDIKAKDRNRNLNGYAIGYNYNVFVQYWMPFYGNYGMHDASWRSSFGGPDYYYGGSHGCVNMPTDTAAWVYNWADVGTPVWVHT